MLRLKKEHFGFIKFFQLIF